MNKTNFPHINLINTQTTRLATCPGIRVPSSTVSRIDPGSDHGLTSLSGLSLGRVQFLFKIVVYGIFISTFREGNVVPHSYAELVRARAGGPRRKPPQLNRKLFIYIALAIYYNIILRCDLMRRVISLSLHV